MASISARKNKNGEITSYTIRVSRGYDTNGKRMNPYRTSFHPDKGLTERKARKQAEKAAEEFEKQCKRTAGEGGFMKLCDFVPVYFKSMEGTLAPRTLESYSHIVNNYLMPCLGNYRLNEITPVQVQYYVDEQSRSEKINKKGEKTGEKISPSTVKIRLAVLQSVLSYGVKLGYLTDNPAKADKLTLPKPDGREINIFSRQEITAMLAAAKSEPLWFETLLNLAVFTGMRKGELTALKYSDVSFERMKITVSRSAYKISGIKQSTKSPKSGRERTVSINRQCCELLGQLKEKSGGEFVFHNEEGEMLAPVKITRYFSKFLKKNGITHRKFHALRHTSATMLLYSGTDIKTVQSRLGHAGLVTTNKYLHLVDDADKTAVERLDAYLSGSNINSIPRSQNVI